MALVPLFGLIVDVNGDVVAGAKAIFYQSGTTTPQSTYTDASGGSPATNPVIANANGVFVTWLDDSLTYKIVVKDSAEATTYFSADSVDPSAFIGIVINTGVSDQLLSTTSSPTFANLIVTGDLTASGYTFDLTNPVDGQGLVFDGSEIINQTLTGTGDVLKAELKNYTGVVTVREQTGANMDGVTADDTAFAAAVTAANTSNHHRRIVVDGPVLLTTRQDIPSDIELEIQAGGSIVWASKSATTGPLRLTGDNISIILNGKIKGPFADSPPTPDFPNTDVITASQTLAVNTLYFFNDASGAITGTLPTTHADGDKIGVFRHVANNGGTVERGGAEEIRAFGADSNVTSIAQNDFECLTYTWSASDSRWNVTSEIRVIEGQNGIIGNNDSVTANENIIVTGTGSVEGFGYCGLLFVNAELVAEKVKLYNCGYGGAISGSPLNRFVLNGVKLWDIGPGLAGAAPFTNHYGATATADSAPLYRLPKNVHFYQCDVRNIYRWVGLDFHGADQSSIIDNEFDTVFQPIYPGFSDDAAEDTEVIATTSGSTSTGQRDIIFASVAGLSVGMYVKGATYTFHNTRIVGISGSTVTLNQDVEVTIPDATALTFHTVANTKNSVIAFNKGDAGDLYLIDSAILLASYDTSPAENVIITSNTFTGYGTNDKTTGDLTRFTAAGRGQNAAIEIDISTSVQVTNNALPEFTGQGIYWSTYSLGNNRIADNALGKVVPFNSLSEGIHIQNPELSQGVCEGNSFEERDSTLTAIETGTATKGAAPYGWRLGNQWFLDVTTQYGTNATSLVNSMGIAIGRDPLTGTGNFNISIGALTAGDSYTTGGENVFIGYQAGRVSTSATRNVGIGPNTLDALTTGSNNSAIGYAAASALQDGDSNTAFGSAALLSNVSGDSNTAIGREAMESATGSNGTALGAFSGEEGTGDNNTSVGAFAARFNDTGSGNTAVGASALSGNSGSTTDADNNTAVGYLSLFEIGDGNNNTAVGASAGRNITDGLDNVLVGQLAGDVLTTGDRNIIIGRNADASGATASDELNIGNFLKSANMTGKVATLGSAGVDYIPTSSGTTGGASSAGAGNQYVELEINGTTYKLLHDGTA